MKKMGLITDGEISLLKRNAEKAVAEAVDIPIVLYNVPSRTGTNMLPDTVAQLSRVPNIVAIKEAAGKVDQVSEILKEKAGAAGPGHRLDDARVTVLPDARTNQIVVIAPEGAEAEVLTPGT